MATAATLGARTLQAHEKAAEVVAGHGSAERLEKLRDIDITRASSPRYPAYLSAFQAEALAALAEIAEEQNRRIAELGGLVEDQAGRIKKLEEATAKPAAAPKK